MTSKIALLVFTISVLLTSFSIMNLPQANALEPSTFDDSHTTARFGNSKVCGDHLCVPGEHAKWVNAVSQSQKLGHGKVGPHSNGSDVMHELADTIPQPTTTH